MTLIEYKHYHHYDIWRIDLEYDGEDECVEYVKTICEDERTIDDYVELMNDNNSRYHYYYKLA